VYCKRCLRAAVTAIETADAVRTKNISAGGLVQLL
jgi:hypothetical protein